MSSRSKESAVHDVGGLPAGPVDPIVTEALPWEKLAIAVNNALKAAPGVGITTDEGRRAREEFGEELYNELGYFEKGIEALRRLLIEKGVITDDELSARMDAIAQKIARQGR